jgi:DnaJ-class molecular chaperone
MSYYDTLGVPKNATQEEIKRAYKKLVMQHHPDRGGDHTKFTEITAAYDVLGDPKKRQEYDNPPVENNFQFRSGDFDVDDIQNIFNQMFGRNMHRMIKKNKDVRISVNLTLEDVAVGKEIVASYHLPSSRLETATVKIPPGVRDGETVKVVGFGDDSIKNFNRGDLLILIRVLPHPKFTRDNNNISLKCNVDVFDLMCGTELIIEDLTGRAARVNIKAGTQPGTTLSISGHGLPDVRSGVVGNLYVHLKGTLQPVKDQEIMEKIKELKDAINNSPR